MPEITDVPATELVTSSTAIKEYFGAGSRPVETAELSTFIKANGGDAYHALAEECARELGKKLKVTPL